eukprot:CAMPEP_0185581082 /NCGR_PEP_ID=MMETSP0434-20130131/18087_1 /TAXON_ID=626734 ORGANISM="Favella taraikaensis, Strain Fe Narragansett Bay" /NCGR_SAMPLE_ID=MMETSP0434 /ASSEMBLY_ACC=CAM_ASM_000379 /LENGTH=46 /DNA_ID= /DNA_START= /DNA_END= /DNA_ORIENTATION=
MTKEEQAALLGPLAASLPVKTKAPKQRKTVNVAELIKQRQSEKDKG